MNPRALLLRKQVRFPFGGVTYVPPPASIIGAKGPRCIRRTANGLRGATRRSTPPGGYRPSHLGARTATWPTSQAVAGNVAIDPMSEGRRVGLIAKKETNTAI